VLNHILSDFCRGPSRRALVAAALFHDAHHESYNAIFGAGLGR
jgi:hypothetical protein